MQTHENDLGLGPDSHRTAAHRRDQRAEAAAAEAVAGRRPDLLSPGAILHLQKSAGNAGVASLMSEEEEESRSPVTEVVASGGGRPLDEPTRSFMESRLGHDFADVRIHTDVRAAESARAVDAQAYTVGRDIVFQAGSYAPETDAGRRMLAHELTHVVQQQSGPVDGTPAPGGITISHPSDRFEQAAQRSADQAVTAESPAAATAATAAPAPALQRAAPEEEEEPVHAYSVQREAAEEEIPEEEGASA